MSEVDGGSAEQDGGAGRLEEVRKAEQARYRPLIDGAARIGVLMGGMGLPWEAVTPFVTRFSSELAEYMELSVDDAVARVGIMTQGGGQLFAHRMARFMEEQGVPEPRLRRFLATARHFGHRNLLLKVVVGETGVEELGWYMRTRPELGVGLAWLREVGVTDPELALCTRISGALKKQHLHFLAASERLDAKGVQSRDKIYWSQAESGSSWERLRAASALAGVDEGTWARLDEHVLDLASKQSFLSLSYQGGQRWGGVKLDLHEVRGEILLQLAASEGHSRAALDRLRLLSRLSSSGTLDFVGLRLRAGLPIQSRAYLCRWV